jgi:hypothetical protein
VPNVPSLPTPSDYTALDTLDRLEELLEEMAELGVTSRAEVEERIAALEAQIHDLDDSGSS